MWLLTLLGNVDLVLKGPDTVTESGVAVVAHNQRFLRCFQEDLPDRNKRSRAAQIEQHSHKPLPEDTAISESISVIPHQLGWRSWEG